jgi:hypothetical protein
MDLYANKNIKITTLAFEVRAKENVLNNREELINLTLACEVRAKEDKNLKNSLPLLLRFGQKNVKTINNLSKRYYSIQSSNKKSKYLSYINPIEAKKSNNSISKIIDTLAFEVRAKVKDKKLFLRNSVSAMDIETMEFNKKEIPPLLLRFGKKLRFYKSLKNLNIVKYK